MKDVNKFMKGKKSYKGLKLQLNASTSKKLLKRIFNVNEKDISAIELVFYI